MTGAPTVVAVDFGATSIRVARVALQAPASVEVVHRIAHAPRHDAGGVLRWDWPMLLAALDRGLVAALAAGPVASIGIDTWAVDYGLLDGGGRLVADPVSYRDGRTAGYREVIERIGARRLFEITGTQQMPINTIFQLATHDRRELSSASRLLMLPELLVHHLTGAACWELTSAGSTGLLDLATRTWSDELLDAVGVDAGLFGPISNPGSSVGTWQGVPVRLVGGHDTASAVVAGAAGDAAFVSAGTWLLVGAERPQPDTSVAAQQAGFSNELGVGGEIRLLRNVAGWWLVEECRRAWGDRQTVAELLAAAAEVPPGPFADATDDRFLGPADMPTELIAAAGLAPSASPAEIVRCAVESMAASAAAIVAALGAPAIRVFGGGAQSPLLVDALWRHSGLPVTVGPVEATALGNAIVQGVALDVFDSVADARAEFIGSAAA